MKQKINIVEFPNIDDPNILRHIEYVGKVSVIVNGLKLEIIEKNKNVKITIGLVLSILDRILECGLSLQHLALKGFVRDVSVLLLNIIELRLDLQYISLSKEREDIWINNTKENRKPWKVSEQIKEIFKDRESDIEAEFMIYRLCSMTKHGNPAGGSQSFRFSLDVDKILLSDKNIKLLGSFLFATEINIYTACKAGLNILNKNSLRFNKIEENLEKLHAEIQDFNSKELYDNVMEYVRQQNPEIEEFDREIERLERKKVKSKKELDRLNIELRIMEKKLGINKKI